MSDIREIVNPSDKVTIDCEDLEAARIAVILLGQGWYAIKGDDMPVLALGNAEAWAKEAYGKSMDALFDGMENERLAKAMESVTLVGERSSMNDIAGRARAYAKRLREPEKTK